jgi:hypothetical protein
MAEWRAIDERLASYSGSIQVFGYKAEYGNDRFYLGNYRTDNQQHPSFGLFAKIGQESATRPLTWYDQTLFVFQYAREAQLFRIRNQKYALS